MENNDLAVAFYRNLGTLFYAVAAADKVVREEEFDELKQVVAKHWLPHEEAEDAFHTNAVYQMEIVFDYFKENPRKTEDCFSDFTFFLKEHPSLFTLERRKLISSTANAIASSFSGRNKSELIILAKLDLALFY